MCGNLYAWSNPTVLDVLPQAALPVLTSILSAQGIKSGIPTVSDLIANP